MKRKIGEEHAVPELEVRITWRQWHDGRWEAWVTDDSGRPPHLVRDRAELEWFLAQAYRRELRGGQAETDPRKD